MLYGYKESVAGRISTIISAADTVDEYDNYTLMVSSNSLEYYSDWFVTNFMHYLTDVIFKGFSAKPVLVFHHISKEQRDNFFKFYNIAEVQSEKARDKQKDMIWLENQRVLNEDYQAEEEKALSEGKVAREGMSIEEINGLDKHDPWDRRCEKEKESDKKMREKMKKLKKSGNMSNDSFGGAEEQRTSKKVDDNKSTKKDNGSVGIRSVNVELDPDGTIKIDKVLAHKFKGEDNKETKSKEDKNSLSKNKEKKFIFSPEDFAIALRGDGSSDRLNINGDDGTKRTRIPKEKPVFSPEVEEMRRKYKEEKDGIKNDRNRVLKEEEINQSLEERDNNIFRGCYLNGDEEILVSELPECIQQSIKSLKITDERVALKNYPYNSELAGRILLPSYGNKNVGNYIIKYENLEIDGHIQVIGCSVIIAKKTLIDVPGWAVYDRFNKTISKVDDKEEITHKITII